MATLDKEVRRVLLGKTKLLDDGRLSTLEEGDYIMPRGISDGAGAVRFLGVAKKSRVLETDLPEQKVREEAQKIMRNMGRGVVLQEVPEAAACLMRYLLTRPAVLCYCRQNDLPVLTAYTGRGLTGWISLLRVMRTFRNQLPESISISDVQPPDTRKEEKEAKKQEKEARKREKEEKKLAKQKRREREEGIRPAKETEETEKETAGTEAAGKE